MGLWEIGRKIILRAVEVKRGRKKETVVLVLWGICHSNRDKSGFTYEFSLDEPEVGVGQGGGDKRGEPVDKAEGPRCTHRVKTRGTRP